MATRFTHALLGVLLLATHGTFAGPGKPPVQLDAIWMLFLFEQLCTLSCKLGQGRRCLIGPELHCAAASPCMTANIEASGSCYFAGSSTHQLRQTTVVQQPSMPSSPSAGWLIWEIGQSLGQTVPANFKYSILSNFRSGRHARVCEEEASENFPLQLF